MNKLLLIDDEADVQYSFQRIFDSPEIELTTASSGEEALRLLPKVKPDLVLMDVRMGGLSGLETLRRIRQIDSKLLVILMTAYGTTQTAIEAMKLGAYDYLLKPFDVPSSRIWFLMRSRRRDMKQVVSYQPLLESEDYELGIVGRSERDSRCFKLIGQLAAASDATALITGESGTGVNCCQAIYHHSKRSEQPFLAVNCAAIPEQLLKANVRPLNGALSRGYHAWRVGKFEQCNRGTLFLDEIGDMTPAADQDPSRAAVRDFRGVGGNQPIKVDVRIIADQQAFEQAVRRATPGRRPFYRLNVVRIHIPCGNAVRTFVCWCHFL
jgi:two-component system nitrogen regulation response regulator GlnG